MQENYELHWKDYYEILQVHPLAEQEVIEAAFNKLAGKYHPDHNNSPDATRRMADINEAHEILCNPIKRQKYYGFYLLKIRPVISSPIPKKVEPIQDIPRTELRWCPSCHNSIYMKILMVNHKKAFAVCPECNKTWDLKKSNKDDIDKRIEEFLAHYHAK